MVFNLRSVAFQVPETEGRSDAVAATKVRVYSFRFERLRDSVVAGFLDHVRRLRNAEHHCLGNAIALVSEAPGFWKSGARGGISPGQVVGFRGMASSSTTISISVLDTKPSDGIPRWLDALSLVAVGSVS
jgi:hypothetical protein